MQYLYVVAFLIGIPYLVHDRTLLIVIYAVGGFFYLRWEMQKEIKAQVEALRADDQAEEFFTDLEPANSSHHVAELLAGEPRKISLVCIFPQGSEKRAEETFERLSQVISKHQLKIFLEKIGTHEYEFSGMINYSAMVEACRKNNVTVALIVGPPVGGKTSEQDFCDLVTVTLDVQGVNVGFLKGADCTEDHKCLNVALDLALTTRDRQKKAA